MWREGKMCWGYLSLRNFIFSKFEIKLRWNNGVSLVPYFLLFTNFFNVVLANIFISMWENKKFQPLYSAQNRPKQHTNSQIMQKIQVSWFFSKCPKKVSMRKFPTFLRCLKCSSNINIPKMPNFFEHLDFSKVPKIFGQ